MILLWVIIGVLVVVGLFFAYLLFRTPAYEGRHAVPGRPTIIRARVKEYIDNSLIPE